MAAGAKTGCWGVWRAAQEGDREERGGQGRAVWRFRVKCSCVCVAVFQGFCVLAQGARICALCCLQGGFIKLADEGADAQAIEQPFCAGLGKGK